MIIIKFKFHDINIIINLTLENYPNQLYRFGQNENEMSNLEHGLFN